MCVSIVYLCGYYIHIFLERSLLFKSMLDTSTWLPALFCCKLQCVCVRRRSLVPDFRSPASVVAGLCAPTSALEACFILLRWRSGGAPPPCFRRCSGGLLSSQPAACILFPFRLLSSADTFVCFMCVTYAFFTLQPPYVLSYLANPILLHFRDTMTVALCGDHAHNFNVDQYMDMTTHTREPLIILFVDLTCSVFNVVSLILDWTTARNFFCLLPLIPRTHTTKNNSGNVSLQGSSVCKWYASLHIYTRGCSSTGQAVSITMI